MNKELDKVINDYMGALQRVEEYDQHSGKRISRKTLLEKAWLKALKYDMADSENIEFCSVPIPKEVAGRLEKLRDSKELPISMWALITGTIEAVIDVFEEWELS